jgi:SIR2-like domain
VLYDEDFFFIFKLHENVDDESIVLTRRDYDNVMYRNPHIRTFLETDFDDEYAILCRILDT